MAANQTPPVNMTLLSLDDIQYDLNQISNLSVNDECQVRCTSKATSLLSYAIFLVESSAGIDHV